MNIKSTNPMQKYSKPKYEKKDLGENPFIDNLIISVNELEFANQYKHDGEMLLPASKEVEYEKFTKLFTSASRREKINTLTPRSKELLLWVMNEIKPGEDSFWLNKRRYMSEVNITAIDTYKNAAKELVKIKILGITIVQDVFWINPHFFFKGDRVSKYPKNVIKYDKVKQKQAELLERQLTIDYEKQFYVEE